MKTRICLIDVQAWTGNGLQTFRFGTHGYHTRPTDTPANTHYAPRLTRPPLVTQSFNTTLTMAGGFVASYGEVVLANNDGGLDDWNEYAFDGRQIIVRFGERSAAYADLQILTLQMEQVVPEGQTMVIKLRGKESLTLAALQTTTYLGNNELPLGVEGTADIKDQVKPLLFGPVRNITPICVNTSKLIYQVNGNGAFTDYMLQGPTLVTAWDSITDLDVIASFGYYTGGISGLVVKDGGVALTFSNNVTNLIDLMSNTVTGGEYITLADAGLFRLGSKPQLSLTADVADATSISVAPTAANLFKRILIGFSVVSPADLIDAEFDAVNAVSAEHIGLFIRAAQNVRTTLDSIATTACLVWGFDLLTGAFHLYSLHDSMGPVVAEFDQNDILSLDAVATPVPASGVTMLWNRNYTPLDRSAVAGILTEEATTALNVQWQKALLRNPDALVRHPLAVEQTIETLYQSDPTMALATHVAIASADQRPIMIKVPLRRVFLLNDTVRVKYPRYKLNNGVEFKITKQTIDLENNMLELALWRKL